MANQTLYKESYCAHVLLSQDEAYFSIGESKGFSLVYESWNTSQVEELLQRKQVKEASRKELETFIYVLYYDRDMGQSTQSRWFRTFD